MIRIVIKKSKENIPYYYEVSGHAGYANPGKDIVCAAVSVLTITIANSMELNTKDIKKISVNEKTNVITIDLPTIRECKGTEELKVLTSTLYLGITQIKEEYEHKYIDVKEEIDND